MSLNSIILLFVTACVIKIIYEILNLSVRPKCLYLIVLCTIYYDKVIKIIKLYYGLYIHVYSKNMNDRI